MVLTAEHAETAERQSVECAVEVGSSVISAVSAVKYVTVIAN
jgi:hypothetical protein